MTGSSIRSTLWVSATPPNLLLDNSALILRYIVSVIITNVQEAQHTLGQVTISYLVPTQRSWRILNIGAGNQNRTGESSLARKQVTSTSYPLWLPNLGSNQGPCD